MLFSVDLSLPVSLQCHCCVFIFPATLQPHLCCCGLPCTSSASFGLCCNQSDLQWNAISSPACLRLANGFLLQVLIRNHLLNVVYKASHSMSPACLCKTGSPVSMTFLECQTHFSCWLWKPFAVAVSLTADSPLSLGLIMYPRLQFVM